MNTRSLTPFRLGVLTFVLALFAPLAFGQMPQQGGGAEMLSSSDVSDEEMQKVASIMAKVQMSTRDERMQMRKDMKNKYGNPQEMDSTQKAQARREMRKRQMAMQKKTMKIMQKEAQNADMDPQRVQMILKSSQKDQELGKRLKQAMKKQMKSQQGMQGGQQGGGQQGGGSNR